VINASEQASGAVYKRAGRGDWVFYPKTKVFGLVIEVDNQTGFMQVHCFKTMKMRWLTVHNFGQYKVV